MTRVLVFGTFDHLHPGHLYVLEEAQKRGELFVVVARDDNVEHIKGRRPDHNEQERMQAVSAATPAASVMLGDASDYMVPVHHIQPDLILLGYDQRMPPEINQDDLPCPVERLDAHEPEKYKTSLMRRK